MSTKQNFMTTGMSDPKIVGKPRSTVGKGGGALPPGCQVVNGFDAAKNYARMGQQSNAGYSPLPIPGRVAARSVFPIAPTAMGLGEL